jgi:hypothetical protein
VAEHLADDLRVDAVPERYCRRPVCRRSWKRIGARPGALDGGVEGLAYPSGVERATVSGAEHQVEVSPLAAGGLADNRLPVLVGPRPIGHRA